MQGLWPGTLVAGGLGRYGSDVRTGGGRDQERSVAGQGEGERCGQQNREKRKGSGGKGCQRSRQGRKRRRIRSEGASCIRSERRNGRKRKSEEEEPLWEVFGRRDPFFGRRFCLSTQTTGSANRASFRTSIRGVALSSGRWFRCIEIPKASANRIRYGLCLAIGRGERTAIVFQFRVNPTVFFFWLIDNDLSRKFHPPKSVRDGSLSCMYTFIEFIWNATNKLMQNDSFITTLLNNANRKVFLPKKRFIVSKTFY
mmetsp:Transcript_17937/g.37003  ORF Transcript_17937/g.37003 Transcript_17937/m.37003 type:complete len:255 (+) Transcript_17937:570-1334(+)